MTATDRLNAMQQRCDAAPVGEWYAESDGSVWVDHSHGDRDSSSALTRPLPIWAYGAAEFIAAARTDLPATIAALRAVLDLHLPVLDILPWLPRHPAYCGECSDDEVVTYPCPTVRAITEALT